jgi:hypothetical protein
MGSGSTVSAAVAVGYRAIGIERQRDCFEMARRAVPKLAVLDVDWEPFESYNGGNGRTRAYCPSAMTGLPLLNRT